MSETLLKQGNYSVGSLIKVIEIGTLSLPDIAEWTLRPGGSRKHYTSA